MVPCFELARLSPEAASGSFGHTMSTFPLAGVLGESSSWVAPLFEVIDLTKLRSSSSYTVPLPWTSGRSPSRDTDIFSQVPGMLITSSRFSLHPARMMIILSKICFKTGLSVYAVKPTTMLKERPQYHAIALHWDLGSEANLLESVGI